VGLRAKVLAVGVLVAVFGLAAPAAAAPTTDRSEFDFTFVHFGREVTCTLVGTSSYELRGRTPDGAYVNGIGGSTALVDSEPACHAALVKVRVHLYWLRRDHLGLGVLDASSETEVARASTRAVQPDPAAIVRGAHAAVFQCDQPAGLCTARFGTHAK
jgi:hypothetical protein